MSEATIFALSSGAPPAGVAVIRVSGEGVRFGLETIIGPLPPPRRAALRPIRDPRTGELLDAGLVLFFPGPHSFTGEDVAELQIHGGRAVVAAVLDTLGGLPGFAPAEAGAFTRRAFENGRLDLTEVEGLADLVQAETAWQRRLARAQAGGALRSLYDGWRSRLIRARALIEAELDFPDEEDVPGSVSERVWADIAVLSTEVEVHLARAEWGERARSGFEIVLLGPPNAGKSSLLNALAGRDVAIVTDEPGTTRDLIEVRLDLAGYPVTLVDTAGLRQATGRVEEEGIRRALARGARADLLLRLDPADEMVQPRSAPDGVAPEGPPALRIASKADVIDSDSKHFLREAGSMPVSSTTGEGLDDLIRAIGRALGVAEPPPDLALPNRARHRAGLLALSESLQAARKSGLALELRAEELRRAGDALGRLTGRIDVEDMLDVIFREFCIGK
ncbi:tRNA uridine-5-carboxymethylaminomethyl(34) synthesis GTPase MnmE [Prosthecomicrobium pneumaticum]|nr:tRNA uridine-5-carboxymethylaminomethyl(34) synthesis GTPase MnmE [Prosthecomicrobium pneumaticum]